MVTSRVLRLSSVWYIYIYSVNTLFCLLFLDTTKIVTLKETLAFSVGEDFEVVV
jgi:hypothetical protein